MWKVWKNMKKNIKEYDRTYGEYEEIMRGKYEGI